VRVRLGSIDTAAVYTSPSLLLADGGAAVTAGSNCDVAVPTGTEWLASSDRDAADPTPKGYKKKKTDVAPELSNLVVYTQAVKFRGEYLSFSSSSSSSTEMLSSLSLINKS